MTDEISVFGSIFERAMESDAQLLHNKIHAEDIHIQQETPEHLRPKFGPRNREAARKHAHNIILDTLKLLTENGPDEFSDDALITAATNLEKIYLKSSPDAPERIQELYNAALAYYLAGQYARAFVIMRAIENEEENPPDQILMRLMFLRQLESLKDETTRFLRQNNTDRFLASAVEAGDLTESAAIDAALKTTLCRVYVHFLEYARTGARHHIEQSIALSWLACELAIQLATDRQMHSWWWVFHSTLTLLREFFRSSLWTQLQPMLEADTSGLVKKYIETAFARSPLPILELWRSQSHALLYIQDGNSYCLKMPTSAGKTQIAELAILQFLKDTFDTSSKKCIYVAPFRALAVEIENSLKKSFEPLRIKVSQLYGSYDLNPVETLLTEEARILIGTPEKLDAVMRYTSEVAEEIGLIIVDEGHIIDSGDRGLRYELFIQRLVRRYQRKGARIIFISAVMPNVEQFGEWITGRPGREGLIESDWRPSQQMLGTLTWNGQSGRIDFLYRDLKPLDEDFFVTNYITPFDRQELQNAGLRIRKFPRKNASKGDILAVAALQAADDGATYVYAPQIPLVERIAESVINVIKIQQAINQSQQNEIPVIPVSSKPEHQEKLQRCIEYAEEYTGKDSLVVRALQQGFVVHHGDVPRTLRIFLEELIRDGVLQLVVATNTLAQGVNLPVRTVLIHSFQQGPGQTLSSRDFWNICGRAGRAMKETEGFVLLLNNTAQCKTRNDAAEQTSQAQKTLQSYVDQATGQSETQEVSSAVRNLLQRLRTSVTNDYPPFGYPDIAELCERLASNNVDWLDPVLKRQLNILDSQLLGLMEEEGLVEVGVEQITQWFQDSLLYIQLRNSPLYSWLTYEDAVSLIVQRVRVISETCRTPARRRRFYRMGISVNDCLVIESRWEELVEYIQQAQDYMAWTAEERAGYVVCLCTDFLMQLDDVSSDDDKPPDDCWPEMLKSWMLGQNADQIATCDGVPDEWTDPMKISTFLDNLCEFRLPWGLNAVTMFLQTIDAEEDDDAFAVPEVMAYFPAMLRFGVHDPVATILLTIGLRHRQAALALANIYNAILEPRSVLGWINGLDVEAMRSQIDDADLHGILQEFVQSRQTQYQPVTLNPSVELTISMPVNEQTLALEQDAVLITQIQGEQVHLFLPDSIDYLCGIELTDSALRSRLQTGEATIKVRDIYFQSEYVEISLTIE
jgi:hypothetical protein